MHSSQLQNSLLQVLENYRRCGLTRFEQVDADALPAALQSQIASLHANDTDLNVAMSESVAADTPVVRTSPTELPSVIPQQAASTTSRAEAETLGSVATSWSLPVLPADERQSKFTELDARVRACRQCADIVGFRQQTVFGCGPLHPTVCFMGEAPGADEDRSGQPFVGKAGQLLTKIITAMKLKREEVYILNALKCRPPQNRTPMPNEISNCRDYVEAQLEVLQPKYIVCLGAVAVQSLLQSTQSIGRLRGKFYSYRGARVVVTYHPSYLLRQEDAKRLVWEDMQMLMRELA